MGNVYNSKNVLESTSLCNKISKHFFYSSFRIVQITDFWGKFLHECRQEKSETFTEF